MVKFPPVKVDTILADGVPVAAGEWAVLLEGADVPAVSAAARLMFTATKLRPFGVETAPTVGTSTHCAPSHSAR